MNCIVLFGDYQPQSAHMPESGVVTLWYSVEIIVMHPEAINAEW